MALGIACAGTGLCGAIALQEPMAKFEPVNFVRQGVLIASAMILIQQTDKAFQQELLHSAVPNKHEDVMVKYGAILGNGSRWPLSQFNSRLLKTRTSKCPS